ncbi:hypothetical protein V5799_005699 [Amblyomma americanum]|uniref:Secreted protein n=1 Tax=Amblyomma americanum TaxID=6943 RepID=A0AAQ4DYI0_AMBAM
MFFNKISLHKTFLALLCNSSVVQRSQQQVRSPEIVLYVATETLNVHLLVKNELSPLSHPFRVAEMQ